MSSTADRGWFSRLIARRLRSSGNPTTGARTPGLAQLYYQAQLDIFLTSLSAYLHATALIKSPGVSAAEFLPYATDNLNTLSDFLTEAAGAIDEGRYLGELANVTIMGATADHIVGASRYAGIDLDLPSAVKAHYDRRSLPVTGRTPGPASSR